MRLNLPTLLGATAIAALVGTVQAGEYSQTLDARGAAFSHAATASYHGGCDHDYGCEPACEAPCGDAGCCDDACFDTSCGCCGANDCCGTICYGGAALVWAKPHLNDHMAIGIITDRADFTGGDVLLSIDELLFDPDYDTTPRIWIGVRRCDGLGVRATYWEYDDSQSLAVDFDDEDSIAFTVVDINRLPEVLFDFENEFPEFDDFSVFASAVYDLNVETLDLEVTQDFGWCGNNLTISGGVRYARLQHLYAFAVLDEADDETTAVTNAHDFEGVGPTFAIELTREICPCSGWSVYVNARQSVVFGERVQDAAILDITANGNVEEAITARSANDCEVMGITDVQFGVQYNTMCGCDTVVVMRAGWEGMLFHGAGGPNDTYSDVGFEGFSLSLAAER